MSVPSVSESTNKPSSLAWPALQKGLVFAALTLYLLTKLVPLVNHDLWHLMALARQAIQSGHIPTGDVFSYAPTFPVVVHHEWLCGFIALAALSIPHGLAWVWLALIAVLVWFIVWALRDLEPAFLLLAGLLVGPLAMYSHIMPVLAQAYSVVFTGVLLYGFELHRRGSRSWMAVWIPVWLLWINMHGGIMAGAALVEFFILEQLIRRDSIRALLGLLTLMGVLVLVNPDGWHYFLFLLRALTVRTPEVPQWHSNWLWNGAWGFALPYLVSVLILAAVTWRKGIRGAGTIVACGMACVAIIAHKLLPFYALAWLYWAGKQAWRCSPGQSVAAALISMAAIPWLAFGVAAQRPWAILLPGDNPSYFGDHFTQPIGPADFLAARGFRGNVMTYFHHGAYMSWRLYPAVKVSCDARYYDAYPPADVDRNFALYLHSPQLLPQELQRLPKTDAILCFRLSPLAPELAKLGWPRVYDDDAFVLYARPGLDLPYQDRRGQSIRQWF